MLALLPAAICLGGCASPDEPTARQRAIVPQPVGDLGAWQQGNDVVLTFTLPARSERNENLARPPAVEIYRGTIESQRSAEKTSVRLIYTIPGEMTDSYTEGGKIVYRDQLQPGELRQSASIVSERVYLVRTRMARDRSSRESNRVTQLIKPPPEPVVDVRAKVVPATGEPSLKAVVLEWPRDANTVYDVYRAEVTTSGEASAVTGGSTKRTPLLMVTQVRIGENDGDPLLQYRDEKVQLGHTYVYVIRRTFEFIGPFDVQSADSKPVEITVADIQPPAAPQGVEAVIVPASQQVPAHVSLSWAISPETGVAGYVVYRSEQAAARGIKMNENLLGSPTYRDLSVAPGGRYFYSVTAVDGAGQESPPSAAVEAQIPQ